MGQLFYPVFYIESVFVLGTCTDIFTEILTHAQTVCIRLSFLPRKGVSVVQKLCIQECHQVSMKIRENTILNAY